MGIPLRVEPVPGTLPEVDGYRIPREEYALRDPGPHHRGAGGPPPGRLGRAGRGPAGHRGAAQAGRPGHRGGPRPRGPRRAAPGRPEPGPPVRRGGQPKPGAPALPGRGAHRRPVPPRVPARPLVPHRLRPPPGRGAQLPARPHRGRGRARRRTAAFEPPTTAVPGPGPGHLGARRRAAGPGPGAHRRPPGQLGACSTSGPTTSCEEDRRRLGRGGAPGHQPGRLPLLRAVVPRARRDPRARPSSATTWWRWLS